MSKLKLPVTILCSVLMLCQSGCFPMIQCQQQQSDHDGPHEQVIVDYVQAIADANLDDARELTTLEFAERILIDIDTAKANLTAPNFPYSETIYLESVSLEDLMTDFETGIEARVFALPFTFLLVKRDGNWLIYDIYYTERD